MKKIDTAIIISTIILIIFFFIFLYLGIIYLDFVTLPSTRIKPFDKDYLLNEYDKVNKNYSSEKIDNIFIYTGLISLCFSSIAFVDFTYKLSNYWKEINKRNMIIYIVIGLGIYLFFIYLLNTKIVHNKYYMDLYPLFIIDIILLLLNKDIIKN